VDLATHMPTPIAGNMRASGGRGARRIGSKAPLGPDRLPDFPSSPKSAIP